MTELCPESVQKLPFANCPGRSSRIFQKISEQIHLKGSTICLRTAEKWAKLNTIHCHTHPVSWSYLGGHQISHRKVDRFLTQKCSNETVFARSTFPRETTLICKTGFHLGTAGIRERPDPASGLVSSGMPGWDPALVCSRPAKGCRALVRAGSPPRWWLQPPGTSRGRAGDSATTRPPHQAPPPGPAASLPSVGQERARCWLRLAVLASRAARAWKVFAAPLAAR